MTELVLPSIHVRQKSGAIWGSEWMTFNGIEGGSWGSGVQEYSAGNKGDFNRAFFDAWIYRCVDVRGAAITQAPLRVYAPTDKGRKPVDHEAIGVLTATNPMGWLPGDKLLRATLASLDLHGHFAWQMAFNNARIPTEIYFVPPAAYEPKANKKSGYFDGIKIRDKGEDRIIPPNQLVYDATMSLVNPVSGTSKVQAARMELNLRSYGMASNLWFLKNNMRPDWILTGDFAPTDENVSKIRRQINQWAGGDNRRGPLILGGGNMTAHLMTMQHKDAEWVMQQRLSQESLAAIFGVPMPMMNVLENATLANVDAYKLIFWHDTMTPELKDLADSLTRTYLYRWPDALRHGLTLGFDLNAVEGLGEDLNKIWERFMAFMDRVDKQVMSGSMTPNKARRAIAAMAEQLGLDSEPWQGPVPQGDDRMINWNLIPSQQASATMVLNAMASRGPNAAIVQDAPGATGFEAAAEQMLQDQAEIAAARSRGPAKSAYIRVDHRDGSAVPQEARKAIAKAGRSTADPMPLRDARLQPIQQKTVRKLKRFFQDLQVQALRKLRERQKADPPDQDYWDRQAAEGDLNEIVGEAVGLTGAAAFDAAAEDFGLAVSWDVSNPWLPAYMGLRANLIKGIEQTTMDALIASLTAGGQAGESMPDLGKRVTEVFGEAIGSRADTIARTETIQAYAGASLQAYRDAGITQVKVYDGTVDDECAAVAGEVISVAEGERLMATEHPNGTRGVAPVVDLSQSMAAAVTMREGASGAPGVVTGTLTKSAHECQPPAIKSVRRSQNFTCECGQGWMYRPGGSGPARWQHRP